ncbi:uncharacterized protein LOC110842254 [Folsomia candida]|uniref:uncharacterized protein LOC110842254 n=1 Tax=Folsomia candida TaxID=158441 RepID=UPI00160551A8|nr:uncharacterized protein LOC110842254 [Folsomia candida]
MSDENQPPSKKRHISTDKLNVKHAISEIGIFINKVKNKLEEFIQSKNKILNLSCGENSFNSQDELHGDHNSEDNQIGQFSTSSECQTVFKELGINNVNKKISKLLGISERSVYGIKINDAKLNTESVKKLSSKKIVCEEFFISMIRRLNQEFYKNKEYPTARKLLDRCLDNPEFPRIKLTLFREWMINECKFKYRKINKKPVFLERYDIVAQREFYLRSIRKFRQEGYSVFYSDETWASPDQARSRCWQILLSDEEYKDMTGFWGGDCLRDMNGYAGGFLLKSANGSIIINHIGNELGFLAGGDDVFISKKDTKDYHGNMNSDRYLEWFAKIVGLVPDKSVLVLDQAPYHKKRVKDSIMPTMAWLKADILAWFERNAIPLPENVSNFCTMTKQTLIALSKKYPKPKKFIVEEIAEASGKNIRILWLPPAHCEFNPIELVWSFIKNDIATNNKGNNAEGILELAKLAILKVTPELWSRCVKHAIKYEDRMWDRDKLVDEFISNPKMAQIIITAGNDSSDSSSSDSDDNE